MRKLLALFLGASLSLIAQTEITLIAPVGIRGAVDELIPGFERKTGYKVKPTYGTGLVTKKQVADGLQDDELAREGERLVAEAEQERNRSKDPA